MLNAGTGNLLLRANDLGESAYTRFGNSLGGFRWSSTLDAELANAIADGGSTALFSPTGETVSIDTSDVWSESGAGMAIDQPSGRQVTDSDDHDAYVNRFGASHTFFAADPWGTTREYRLPGVTGGHPVSGLARQVTEAIPAGREGVEESEPITRELQIDRPSATRTELRMPGATSPTYVGATRADGQVERWTSEGGLVARLSFDDQGRPTRVVRGAEVATYSYDGPRLVRVRDFDATVFSLTYDSVGRVTRLVVHPAGGAAATWINREYSPAVDPACLDSPGTERTVIGTSSAGGRAIWCIAGAGTVVGEADEAPVLAPLSPGLSAAAECSEQACGTGTEAESASEVADETAAEPPTPALEDAESSSAGVTALAAGGKCGAKAPTTTFSGIFGIADDTDPDEGQGNSHVFDSRGFDCLKPADSRRIVAWNIADPTARAASAVLETRYQYLVHWLSVAVAAGTRPMVVFDNCLDASKGPACDTPPTVPQYTAAMQAFLADPNLAAARVFTAFNEPDIFKSIDGRRKPYLYATAAPGTPVDASSSMAFRAGAYFQALEALCTTQSVPCKVYAGGLSDSGANPKQPRPPLGTFLTELVAGMGDSAKGSEWSLHYYLALEQRSQRATSCTKADISRAKRSAQCWQRLAMFISALRPAIVKDNQPPHFILAEGAVQYRPILRWKKAPFKDYDGPLNTTASEKTKLRQTRSYMATRALFVERPRIEAKFNIKIDRVYWYHWSKTTARGDRKSWDSALFGARAWPGSDGNVLFDKARPAFVALCELAKPDERAQCWKKAAVVGGET